MPMIDSARILEVLNSSASVNLLKLRNRDIVIEFLINTFINEEATVSSDHVHSLLADFLDLKQVDNDEEYEIESFDSYEVKARKYVRKWTDSGFLTNYQDDQGEIFYEISAHSSKTIDWLLSLQKKEFVGTESRFKDIFNQLKDLVEFTNGDRDNRLAILEEKRLEIEHQIEQLKSGKKVKIYQDYEVIPRYNQLTQAAKELLSDFKEVEDNFKDITRQIYQKHAEGSLTKDHILEFTFNALDQIKDSQQGKSFYAFWSFLLDPVLQEEWTTLSNTLFERLDEREIVVGDFFLKGMKKYLHASGQKVYKANDKMAEKLGRIIRESEGSKIQVTHNVIQEIKTMLIEVGKQENRPDIGLVLESSLEIYPFFEQRLMLEQPEELLYNTRPKLADKDILSSRHLGKLFGQTKIDKEVLRKKIRTVLSGRARVSLFEIIEADGGIADGLPELFGYLSVAKEFKHTINPENTQRILFDAQGQKSINVPEVILLKNE